MNIKSIAAKKGCYVSKLTKYDQLQALIRSLHPIQHEKQLIRMGPSGDGGYLLPDCLDGIDFCFSPGVCNISGFEEQCADRGMKVFMADGSVTTPSILNENFFFMNKHIGCSDSEKLMTLDSWFDSADIEPSADALLQMDIEGHEYVSIINMSENLLKRFRVMVIEFHNLHLLNDEAFFWFAKEALNKLLKYHKVVHIHPNNGHRVISLNDLDIPPYLELTFCRKDFVKSEKFERSFPHPLDEPNTDSEDIKLPSCWYRHEGR